MTAGQALLDEVHRRVLAGPWPGGSPSDARGHLAGLVQDVAPLLGTVETAAAVEGVLARVGGLGVLQPLMADPGVAEVMVNGDGQVWVERAGSLERTSLRMEPGEVLHLIERILAPLGRRIDRTSPVVDARLPDGSRVNAVVAPVAVDGPCLTIRRFSARAIGLHDVAAPDVVDLLRRAVRSRCNLLVSGGAGAGKTTLLNALAAEIDPAARVITIEDAAELRLPGDHVVRLEAHPATAEGVGGVSTRALVRNALRMRPDRIIVGEVRGAEALDMLQAMNTGHEGSLSTCHANSPDDALRRVETMCLLEDGYLPLAAVREQVVSALDLVVQVARQPDGARAVQAVAEVIDRCQTGAGSPADRCHPGTRLLADGGRGGAAGARRPVGGGVGRVSAVVLLAGVALGMAVLARRATSARNARSRLLPASSTADIRWVRAAGTAVLIRLSRGAEARRLDRELPLVLDEVARSLRAGCSLAQALAAAGDVPGPAGQTVAALAGEVQAGQPVAAAADRWAGRSGSPVVGLAAVAVALAAEAGGTSARAVDGVAASLRERAEAADEAHALAAQARLSAVVIGVAPLAFAALAAATDPRTATFLVGSPVGLACLVGGAALDGAALVWMRRIAASVA